MLRPLQDRIIVRRVKSEDKIGLLFIPDNNKEKPQEGEVISVGKGTWRGETFVEPDVKVGDRILFGKYSGTEVKVLGEELLILREEEIFAVMVPDVPKSNSLEN